MTTGNRMASRLARLEARALGSGGLFVVPVYPGETDQEALALARVEPRPADLVVLIRRFCLARPVTSGFPTTG